MVSRTLEEYASSSERWRDLVRDPAGAQEEVLDGLMEVYARTDYGKAHGADRVRGIEDFREKFPVVTYQRLEPIFDEIKRGDFGLLLTGSPIWWALTSGTRGPPKLIPLTADDIADRIEGAGRTLRNFIERTGQTDLLDGYDLSFYWPSSVVRIRTGESEVPCGYISGVYVKKLCEPLGIRMTVSPEESEGLGLPVTRADWAKVFRLSYEKAKDKNVTMYIGAPPPLYFFALQLKGQGGPLPRDIWDIKGLFLSGVAGIHEHYSADLRKFYGNDARVVEMYGASEGNFGAQIDDFPAFAPFYDLYLLEVAVGGEIKMLHELRDGEWGELIVSSKTLPRYNIKDIIQRVDKEHFRIPGRATLSNSIGLAAEESAGGLLEAFLRVF